MSLTPAQLVIRCIGELEDGLWTLVCLDFNLAAQAESLDEAKEKLTLQIADYLEDALTGEDTEHASYYLKRRAPIYFWLKYYRCRFRQVFSSIRNSCSFNLPIPMQPVH